MLRYLALLLVLASAAGSVGCGACCRQSTRTGYPCCPPPASPCCPPGVGVGVTAPPVAAPATAFSIPAAYNR